MSARLMYMTAVLSVVFFPSPAFSQEDPAEAEQIVCEKKVCFDQSTTIGGTVVPLHGMGHAYYVGFRLYSAALYAFEKDAKTGNILLDVPKRLVLHYHRKFKKQEFIEYANLQLSKNPSVDFARIRADVERLSDSYQDVKRGDRYELVYTPGQGTELLLNGKLRVRIPGEEFARAYFGIWLSEYPLDKKLMENLTVNAKVET